MRGFCGRERAERFCSPGLLEEAACLAGSQVWRVPDVCVSRALSHPWSGPSSERVWDAAGFFPGPQPLLLPLRWGKLGSSAPFPHRTPFPVKRSVLLCVRGVPVRGRPAWRVASISAGSGQGSSAAGARPRGPLSPAVGTEDPPESTFFCGPCPRQLRTHSGRGPGQGCGLAWGWSSVWLLTLFTLVFVFFPGKVCVFNNFLSNSKKYHEHVFQQGARPG